MIKVWLAILCLVVSAYSQTTTATALTVSGNPAFIGHTITLRASVTPAATGSVMFLDGFQILGTAVLDASSAAVLALRLGQPRPYRIRAVFAGNATYASSTSAALNLKALPKTPTGFLPPITLPAAARFVDVNRDGIPDLITQNATIRLGNGDGTFRASMPSAAGFPAVVADFNNDGKPDILNPRGALSLGNGDGSFQPPYDAGIDPAARIDVDVVDVNRDGKADVVINSSPELQQFGARAYLAGDASGHFGSARNLIPAGFGFADFNGNRMADGLFSPDGRSTSAFFDLTSFDTASVTAAHTFVPTLTGDVNGDGLDDIVANHAVLFQSIYTVAVQLSSGASTFGTPIVANRPSAWRAVQLADWNGDAFLDIVLANGEVPGITMLAYVAGRGDGSFGERKWIASLPQTGFVFEDINGDSIPDAVLNLGLDTPVTVHLGSVQAGAQAGFQGPSGISPETGSDVRGAFTVSYSAAIVNGRPSPAIARQYVLFNTSVTNERGCFVEIVPAANQFRLWSDTANEWLGPIAGGRAQVLATDLCVLFGAGSRTSLPQSTGATADYESVVDLQFLPEFAGTKYMYLLSTGEDGSNSGWGQFGNIWIVPNPPSTGGPFPKRGPAVVSLSPISGTGDSASFTGVFSHPSGAEGHYLAYMLFLPAPNVADFVAKGSCLIEYNRISTGMRLIDDSGTGWLGGISGVPIGVPGGLLSNSTCTVDLSHATAAVTGEMMVVTAPVTFRAGLARNIATFLQELDTSGTWTGMTQFGNWTNPAGAANQSGPSILGTKIVSTGDNTHIITIASTSGSLLPPREVHLRIGSAIVGAPVCHVVFAPRGNSVALINDAETALVHGGFVLIGAKTGLDNGKCHFYAADLTSSTAGGVYTVNLPLTFFGFPGTKNIYVNVFDGEGRLTHWQQQGTLLNP